MRRRAVVALLGGAVAWPLAPRAQQPRIPVVGFFRSTPAAPFTHLVTAFRKGLNEAGFFEGQNVAVEYRWADHQLDRLPGLAAELVRREVAVIVGNGVAARAAKSATTIIPIIFVMGEDPLKLGLVSSLNRPGGNITGVTFFGGGALKRLELLNELAPKGAAIGVLLDPNSPEGSGELPNMEAVVRGYGRLIVVVQAARGREFEAAFAHFVHAGAGAIQVSGSPFFSAQREALVALSAHYAIPAIYDSREYVEAGGLISYGTSMSEAYRQAGIYTGRILKGTPPGDLPVVQPSLFEMVINLKTARAHGLAIPSTLLARADEVIE